MKSPRVLAALVALAPAIAVAQTADDGYCDFVEGAAAATAAPLYAPELFSQVGYIEQPAFGVTPVTDPSTLRVIAGVRYSLTNILVGRATTARARAECRRYAASEQLQRATSTAAWAARLKIYEQAQPEAERILTAMTTDVEARRATLQEFTATRLRVEELRALAANARRELAASPPAPTRPLGEVASAYRAADAEVEASEARLRSLTAYDLSVRVGVDRFLEGTDQSTRYLAVVQLGINLGALWVGGANDRAAAGRKRYARATTDPLAAYGTTAEQLRATIAVDERRVAEAQTLVADLGKHIDMLASLGSEDSRRLRETLWFDWIKAKAEVAYLQARVTVLRELLGTNAP